MVPRLKKNGYSRILQLVEGKPTGNGREGADEERVAVDLAIKFRLDEVEDAVVAESAPLDVDDDLAHVAVLALPLNDQRNQIRPSISDESTLSIEISRK